MPAYDFRCDRGHVTELTYPMATVPSEALCGHVTGTRRCARTAERVFSAPIVQFHGRSSFTNAYTGRKRRPNAGDDLARPHDSFAEAMAR